MNSIKALGTILPELILLTGIIFVVLLLFLALNRNTAPKAAKKVAPQKENKVVRKKLEGVPNNIFEIALADMISKEWQNASKEGVEKFLYLFFKHEFIFVGANIEKEPNPGPVLPLRNLPIASLKSVDFLMAFSSEHFRIGFAPDVQDTCWLYRKTGGELFQYMKQIMEVSKGLKRQDRTGLFCNAATDYAILWRDDKLHAFSELIDESRFKMVENSPRENLNVTASNSEVTMDYKLDKNLEIKTAKAGQIVRFKNKEKHPLELTEELKKYLATVPDALFGYICSMQLGEADSWHYLIGIEFIREDNFREKQIFNEMAIILKKHIQHPGFADLVTVSDDSVYSKHLRTHTIPFYIRADILDLSILDSQEWKQRRFAALVDDE